MTEKRRLIAVAVFSIAMAWVEAAVVLYLRTLVGRLLPYQPDPLPHFGGLGNAELIREAATLVMLGAVGWLAGHSGRTRMAYAVFAFALWDIFYYLFLIPLTGWPRSLLDWDILFLLPLPWWSPVVAPILIDLALVTGGIVVSQFDRPERPVWPGRGPFIVGAAGAGVVFYAFLANSLAALGGGSNAVRNSLPCFFPWAAFLPGLFLMCVPLADAARQARLALSLSSRAKDRPEEERGG